MRVEGTTVGEETPLASGACIRHLIHRHEPPVPCTPIEVVGETSELVVVNKPAGVPVHTAGQYRKNTVLGILQAQQPSLLPLYPVHRLDKPVSGLLMMARSSGAANKLRTLMESTSVQKLYVARVMGSFPAGPVEVEVPLSWDPRSNHVTAIPPGMSSGLPNPTSQPPKPASTSFTRLSVSPDGLTSLVQCRPKTGRTHQIRVHLQHLGHPIANDTQYGGQFGPSLAPRTIKKRPLQGSPRGTTGDVDMSSMQEESSSQAHNGAKPGAEPVPHDCLYPRKRLKAHAAPGSMQVEHAYLGGHGSDVVPCCVDFTRGSGGVTGGSDELKEGVPIADEAAQGQQGDPMTDLITTGMSVKEVLLSLLVEGGHQDDQCPHCPYMVPRNYPLDLDPLWLHCQSYKCNEWTFEAPLPIWAEEGFSVEH